MQLNDCHAPSLLQCPVAIKEPILLLIAFGENRISEGSRSLSAPHKLVVRMIHAGRCQLKTEFLEKDRCFGALRWQISSYFLNWPSAKCFAGGANAVCQRALSTEQSRARDRDRRVAQYANSA